MIPYFEIHTLPVGPLTIQVWGLFVSLGLLLAMLLFLRSVRKKVLSKDVALDLFLWALVGGLIGARIFYFLFYQNDFSDWFGLFRFWQGGASSLGAFIGGGLAVWFWAKRKNFHWAELAPYFDALAAPFWLGWGIGRLGCFLIHDHVGRLSDFFLAVNFPDAARHDLGLYEALFVFLLYVACLPARQACCLLSAWLKNKPGFLAALSILVYAFARFFLDFLRAADLPQSDPHFFYLTPAQWGMAAVFVILTMLISRFARSVRKSAGGN